MRKLVLLGVLALSSNAFAQSSPSDRTVSTSGFNLAPGEKLVAVNGVPVEQTTPCTHKLFSGAGLAQRKAEQQASEGRCRHVGGGFGNGRYEGVGFSTSSPDAAVRACCYWGQRQAIDVGVARGRNGWYATVIYQ